ncbi:site-specific tyrosine recombinase XerD [uncultured Ruminococcus sp.]|nr:site-specific tyrosine recombinase XerD [uncultured Ruminococcus sp.]
MLCSRVLTGITDNHTITAYKRDCKNFAAYCRTNNVKTPEQLEKQKTEILQKYEDSLENAGYKPATIHRYLSAPCKALNVNMKEVEKPHRTADMIARGRDTGFNIQGQREIIQERFKRLISFQKVVGLRRAELAKLWGRDLRTDESGYLCVYVCNGKGGKDQMQRILPPDVVMIKKFFSEVKPDQKVFTAKEMNNKINLHGLRAEQARKAYLYYQKRLESELNYKYACRKELALRYKTMHTADKTTNQRFLKDIMNDTPYVLRGKNREKAIAQGKSVTYNRLAMMMVSVFHLSHWRLDVTSVNYLV